MKKRRKRNKNQIWNKKTASGTPLKIHGMNPTFKINNKTKRMNKWKLQKKSMKQKKQTYLVQNKATKILINLILKNQIPL